jgi:alpha-amylase/alpha-mannosidase (GH57 family)
MQPIHLAFLFHQHQPFYKDLLRNRYVLPWVRLHSIKSYTGLLLALKEFPEIRATINLVPSLIAQIEEYAAGRAVDEALRLTRKPADSLTESDCLFLLDQFFVGYAPQVIHVFPRYRELMELRNPQGRTAAQALPDFPAAALRDLQVWATLAWFHPLVVARDPALRELRRKGRDFTESDKAAMLRRQDEVIRNVLPLHRQMAESGQIEISTTPFYHPILPLLVNMECAREAMPGVPMPDSRADFAPDAKVQVRRAIELSTRVFGRKPGGLWPAEGSVSMDILPLLREHGIRWIATDEQILARAIISGQARAAGIDLSRDHSASLHHPDGLYQPYALPGDGMPAIVFRDRGLSDAIGFEYHHGGSTPGAENFVWRVSEGARRCSGSPRLASVILDGENPWDHYEEAGVPFLRETFSRLARSPDIRTTRLSDYIEAHPPEKKLERLPAGSWIDANFAAWIGSPDDRAAWSLGAEARNALTRRIAAGTPLDPNALRMAWEEIYIAEGSDWCWWLGGDRTSDQDYLFDELFRNHLSNLYRLIGQEPPASLAQPIGKPLKAAQDAGLDMDLATDGLPGVRAGWKPAGYRRFGAESSAMRRSGEIAGGLVYWFAEKQFFLNLKAGGYGEAVQFDIVFTSCAGPGALWGSAPKRVSVAPALASQSESGAARFSAPVSSLVQRPEDQIQFYIEVRHGNETVLRVPESGVIQAAVPAEAR